MNGEMNIHQFYYTLSMQIDVNNFDGLNGGGTEMIFSSHAIVLNKFRIQNDDSIVFFLLLLRLQSIYYEEKILKVNKYTRRMGGFRVSHPQYMCSNNDSQIERSAALN